MSMRRVRRALGAVVASIVALVAFGAAPASAYEYQYGPSQACYGGYVVAIQAYAYGDSNLYSNYGQEDYAYNIPYYDLVYLFGVSEYSFVSSTAAEAENHVDSIGTQCVL